MLSLASLWMPIVLAAVLVFFVSSLIHMVFQWHKSEYRQLPNEEEVRAVLGKANLAPGMYVTPYCPGGKEMQQPEMQQKFKQGPIAAITMRPNGMPGIGKSLGQWFALNLVVAGLSAGLACTVLARGANAHLVFHFFAVITFMSYFTGSALNAVWMGKLWKAVAVDALDSLLYALVSAAAFAWLWPQ